MRRSVPVVGRSQAQDARKPRYVEVAEALAEAISNGTYPVGSTLPSEAELCSRFSVSRFTARAALGALQKKGYLSRKPKVGSVVVAKDVQTKYSVLVNSTADLLRFSGSTTVRPVRVEDVTLDAGQAAELGGVEGELWIKVSTCRISPDTGLAVSWAEYYLRPDLRPIVPLIGAKRRPVYALIEEFNGRSIVKIEQKVEACMLPKAIAKILGAPLRSPALRAIHRLYSRDDPRPFYSVLSLYPAGRFHMAQTLTRET
ncbi:MAG: GntR family transcriptional regulator [Burkholderiaceae bacterium]|nr:GntR family transcriptional regulator [Burkholderiaceae bacterium]